MTIHTYGHTRTYEMEALLKLFVPAQKFAFSTAANLPAEDHISAVMTPNADGTMHLVCHTQIGSQQRMSEADCLAVQGNALDKELSILLYPQLCDITGLRPPWGMLTGIRPVNLLRRSANRMGSLAKAKEYFRNVWQVSKEKIALAEQILTVQQPVFQQTPKKAVGIYVSIPFCPTRCRYCSFVSHSVSQMRKLLPQYMNALLQEINIVAELLQQTHLAVDTLYIGGGTPTVLEPADLRRLLYALQEKLIAVNTVPLRELTVEAGRPDTITREKLQVLRDYNVTRISVNPQSFNDGVLQAAGRPHSAQDTMNAYLLATEMGFSNINMDLIAGLPCDTLVAFRASVDQAISLHPASITVHCLSLKKAADFYRTLPMPDAKSVGEMVAYAQNSLCSAQYRPYYLYRQKNMAANLENVGYAKAGFESPYNIMMMDDSQTILGIGSGASTKLVGGARGIERLTECKYPYEYLDRFDALMAQKRQLVQQLSQIKEQSGLSVF